MMATRTQLLALLFSAVAVSVHGFNSDNSQVFCCEVGDGTCDYGRSSNAGTGTVDNCNHEYKNKAGPGLGGANLGSKCEDKDGDGKYQCVANSPSATKDPLIRGLDGSFYVLFGKNNTVYNLLSERNHHVNVRLYHPPGFPDHLALYIDAVGILIRSARLAITMVKADPHYYLTLAVNDSPAFAYPGYMVERAVDAFTSYTFRSPQKVVISSRDLVLSVVVNENLYVDVMVDEVAASWGDVHGVLGQTHAAAFKLRYNYARGTAVGELPGEVIKRRSDKPYTMKGQEDDYITSGLLNADDKFSRFEALPTPVSRKLFNHFVAALVHKEAGGRSRVRTNAGALCL